MAEMGRCGDCGSELAPDSPGGLCPNCLLQAGIEDVEDIGAASPPNSLKDDRNLLFGVLAVQLRKLTPWQLVDVAAAWATDPSRTLPHRLVEAGTLTESDRKFIDDVVDRAIQDHKGDASATLISFGGEEQVYQSFRGSVVRDDQTGAVKTLARDAAVADEFAEGLVSGVQEIPGRYSHAIEHARGGMGRVLLVHDEYLMRDVLLKERLPDSPPGTAAEKGTPVSRSMPMIARFLQEARITGQLEHPSIVPVYELGHRKDGSLYYTMKIVRGKTLSESIEAAETLTDRLKFLSHYVDLCQAIAYAHSCRVIHRDIKPENVMIGEFGETVLLDWGLAKIKDKRDIHAEDFAKTLRTVDAGDEVDLAKTAYGQAFGTAAYMPPEQAKGLLDQVDERSDVYSLGAVLYEILTGGPPFSSVSREGIGLHEFIAKVINETPQPITSIEPDTPPELLAICERAMDKDPAKRYQTARELAETMQESIDQERQLRIEAEKARAEAELARQQAAVEKSNAQQRLYMANIALAKQSIDEYRFDRARELLDLCPEEYRHWEWGHLQFLCGQDRMTLAGHSDRIVALSVTADGRRAATGSWDKTVKLWDLRLGQELFSLGELSGRLVSLALSPDGALLATRTEAPGVQVWNTLTRQVVALLPARPVEARTTPLRLLDFSHDARLLVMAGGPWDGTVRIWDVREEREGMTLESDSSGVNSVVFAPGRSVVAALGVDSRIRLWNIAASDPSAAIGVSHEPFMTLEVLDEDIACINFSADGRRIVAGLHSLRGNFGMRSWDIVTEEEVEVSLAEVRPISVAFADDGRQLVAGLEDNTIAVSDFVSGDRLTVFRGHGSPAYGLAFANESKRLVSVGDTTVKVWDANSGGALRTLKGHERTVGALAFSPDGARVVTGSHDTTVRIWDVYSGRSLQEFKGHKDPICSVAFSPDGTRIATASWDLSLRVWDAATGSVVVSLADLKGLQRVSFSPDGNLFATAQASSVMLRDSGTGEITRRLVALAGELCSLGFSRSSGLVLTGNELGTVVAWDVESGEQAVVIEAHAGPVYDSAFSPDGTRIASGGDDGAVKIWDAATGQSLSVFSGTAPVRSISFSPDGLRLLSCDDGGARLWDIESGHELFTLKGPATLASFSPDGRTMAMGTREPTNEVVIAASFPWRESDLPGDSNMSTGRRLELYKRANRGIEPSSAWRGSGSAGNRP